MRSIYPPYPFSSRLCEVQSGVLPESASLPCGNPMRSVTPAGAKEMSQQPGAVSCQNPARISHFMG